MLCNDVGMAYLTFSFFENDGIILLLKLGCTIEDIRCITSTAVGLARDRCHFTIYFSQMLNKASNVNAWYLFVIYC